MTELDAKKSKKYRMEAIWDSDVYAENSKSGQPPDLYYLVAWKGYVKEKKYLEARFGGITSSEANQLILSRPLWEADSNLSVC